MIREPEPDLRRHPRATVRWPVIVESGDRRMALETMNLSAFGAKVRLDEPVFELGMPAHLHFEPPDGRRLDVHAIVWRRDPDGSAFFFIGIDGKDGVFPFQLEARRGACVPFRSLSPKATTARASPALEATM
jgi:hypothetical protein